MKTTIAAIILLAALSSGCNSGYIQEQNLTPLQGGGVTVKANNVAYAELTITDGKIVAVTPVDAIMNPEKTVTFEFSETENGTMLSVKNPFDQPIKYHINMVDYSGNFHKTSSCPVMAGGGAFESWPHPIPQLVVSNFRFLSDGQGFSCIY